jgi:hypothetical protein
MWDYVDFSRYDIDELLRIQDAVDVLTSYNVGQDPEMMKALDQTIQNKRTIEVTA